ncbi:MAG: hypothetical protein ABDH49_08710, partial [Candidatus Hydrothermales bacterium]
MKKIGQIQDFEGKPIQDVLLKTKLKGYGIFITKKGVSYVIYKPSNTNIQYARIDIELIGSSIKKENIEYHNPLPGYSNYYLPSNPDGIIGVITYEKIKIKDIYPG